jgi:hypothetical protein
MARERWGRSSCVWLQEPAGANTDSSASVWRSVQAVCDQEQEVKSLPRLDRRIENQHRYAVVVGIFRRLFIYIFQLLENDDSLKNNRISNFMPRSIKHHSAIFNSRPAKCWQMRIWPINFLRPDTFVSPRSLAMPSVTSRQFSQSPNLHGGLASAMGGIQRQ